MPTLRNSDPSRADEAFARILATPGMTTFLLETDVTACASCVLNIIPNLTRGAKPYGVIENIVTHAEYCGRGYGLVVLRHTLLAHAWDGGCYKVLLMTGQPEIRGFYESGSFDAGAKHAMLARRPTALYPITATGSISTSSSGTASASTPISVLVGRLSGPKKALSSSMIPAR